MKTQEIILDVIGIALVILSIYDFYFRSAPFMESTILGVGGLSLFLLETSSIKKYIKKIIDNKLK
jgi:hypothetical protein